jgi:hypothetical protein
MSIILKSGTMEALPVVQSFCNYRSPCKFASPVTGKFHILSEIIMLDILG